MNDLCDLLTFDLSLLTAFAFDLDVQGHRSKVTPENSRWYDDGNIAHIWGLWIGQTLFDGQYHFRAAWFADLENNRAPLICYIEAFCIILAIGEFFKLELQSRNPGSGSKLTIVLAVSFLEIWRFLDIAAWPWNLMDGPSKTIGHLFYATSSFVHHFVAIGELKLELQSETANLGSKSMIEIFSRVTLKFDGWPTKTIGHLFYATSSFVHHFDVAIGEFKLELQSGNG